MKTRDARKIPMEPTRQLRPPIGRNADIAVDANGTVFLLNKNTLGNFFDGMKMPVLPGP